MAWGMLASAGVNAVGHILNRTGGRKSVSPSTIGTEYINDEIGNIKAAGSELNDSVMKTANAGTGFAELTKNRSRNAMGIGQAESMLDNAMIEGQERAFDRSAQNNMNTQQMVNQMLSLRTNVEQFNANARNNAEATNFQANRADTGGIFDSVSAGIMGYTGQRRDNKRFNQTMGMLFKEGQTTESMLSRYMANQNAKNYSPPNVNYNSQF